MATNTPSVQSRTTDAARYERRGARARNRFEHQVEQTRSSVGRERRSRVTKLVGEAQSRLGSIAP
jgi:hypothetical protein